MKRLLMLMLIGLVGGGCSQFHKKAEQDPLAESIQQINNAARHYQPAPVRKTKEGAAALVNQAILPASLKRRYTVRYYGEVYTLLDDLSEALRFDYKLIGTPPALPRPIWVNHAGKTLYEIFYDIGTRLGHDATLDLMVNPTREKFSVNLIYPD